MFPDLIWLITKDGDPCVYELMKRHYSFQPYKDGRRENPSYRNRKLVVGPGEKLVMITLDGKALFVWRKFIDRSGQSGVNCAVFRNEGAFSGKIQSSTLILAAEELAQTKWPGERMYTYVNTHVVKGDGYCFKKAGWKKCGRTAKRNLLVLEKPAPHP